MRRGLPRITLGQCWLDDDHLTSSLLCWHLFSLSIFRLIHQHYHAKKPTLNNILWSTQLWSSTSRDHLTYLNDMRNAHEWIYTGIAHD
jgi:hypothetical protein